MSRLAYDQEKALAFIDSHSGVQFLDESSRRMFKEFLNKIRSVIDEGKSQESADLLDQVEECCWNAIRVH